jgi:acetyltransferase
MTRLLTHDFGSEPSPWERRHPLDCFFAARSVAVVGATEKAGTPGQAVLHNLMATPFGGPIYPVTPTRSSVLGIRAYATLSALPERPDLIVVTTAAPALPAIIAEAADLGVPGAVIVSAGLRAGAGGADADRQVLAHARRGNLRFIGPDSLGVMSPLSGVNASLAAGMARRGNVAFLSQSGALCAAVLDWSVREMVGFSGFVSVGAMQDVGWGDLISYFGSDPNTKSIVIYMETIGEARAFLSAAREVALSKPIIVLKPGRTAAAAKAAASHTGALAGADDVLEAAFRRCGVLRVNSISSLFYMAEVLAKQPRPQGNRLTILSNAGGPGVLATDALLTSGGALAELSPTTLAELDKLLPPAWNRGNPIDLGGEADPDLYARAFEAARRDTNSDGLLVILTPQARTNATGTAERLRELGHVEGKPVLASWMGGAEVAPGEAILNRADLPTFAYPDTAATVFTSMCRYAENLRALYETPVPSADPADLASGRAQAQALIESVRKAGRTLLTEVESKRLLTCYGLPTVPTEVATTEEEAVRLAQQIGFPVVLKIYSQTIAHKTEAGGVRLNLRDATEVRRAFSAIRDGVTPQPNGFEGVTVQAMVRLEEGCELILGSRVDPQFGPVLVFGMGGPLVELLGDKALGLPPLNTTLARRLMEQTRVYHVLKGARGRPPVDLAALDKLLVAFSQLVAEQRWIKEFDINPLFASGARLVALDARGVLQEPQTAADQLPKPAFRPYPTQYVADWRLTDGTPVTLRPIRPEDEPLMVKFHEGLSERSVYLRYFSPLKLQQRVAHDRLVRICFHDYDRELALVAERKDPQSSRHEILGVGRLSKLPGTTEAEIALVVSDPWQGKGLGRQFMARLVEVGRAERLTKLVALFMADNRQMKHLCQQAGFQLQAGAAGAEQVAELIL